MLSISVNAFNVLLARWTLTLTAPLAVSTVLLYIADAAVEEDLVTHLPGYVHPDGSPKALPTRHCKTRSALQDRLTASS